MVANKSWADISIIGGGVPFLEIQEIGYEVKDNVQDHYGVGAEPVSRGYGNRTYTGTGMKMSFDELKRLEASAPDGQIQNIPPFTVQVIWKPTAQNPTTYTDTLTNVQFTSNKRDLKQGDTKHFMMIDFVYAGLNSTKPI